ncbi:MAG: AbrB/MazE/SpoVT family DNA-binding domain-containing protein [Armatimonadetes bacterium]|nr:AbrB/MazE/SpoVT family DNA-binding domain-containing protein [Armatimonadota bacterium]
MKIMTRIGPGGRVVIPATYRRKLGLKTGDEVVLALEGDEVKLLSRRAAVRQFQALVRQYVPEGRSLVDELLRERREEAARG